MRRASNVRPAGQWETTAAIDRVVLDADQRSRRRLVLTGTQGGRFLLDLRAPVAIRDGDGLELDDGGFVQVAGKPEPLLHVEAPDAPRLARLAWHLGNRHAPVQFVGGALRIQRDDVLAAMLEGLGARVTAIEAPFEPEPGAYVSGHAHRA